MDCSKMHFQMDHDEWSTEHLQRGFHLQKKPVHLISPKTRSGNGETMKRETISFYNRNTSHSHECFPPTEHKAFSLKAGTILVSLRIAEARHVNHLLRVTQYNMVLSALWPCFSSAYLALLCCLDNVLIDNRLSNPTEPCKSQPTSCLALTDSGAGGCCQHNTDAGNLIAFTH